MGPAGPFRALSLDLWFTALYYTPERDAQWTEDRARLLRDALRARDGTKIGVGAVEAAMNAVHSQLRAHGRESIVIHPADLVVQYAEYLRADLAVPPADFAREYSRVGLSEHPPIANPEAVSVVQALSARKIPVIALTNTGRPGSAWQEYLRDSLNLEFQHVIASCDSGTAKPDPAIFREAARTLGLAPHEILHVGDRWELDVEGALGAGFGAALYRGLWDRYPEGDYPPTDPDLPRRSSVTSLQSLEEILQRYVWE